MERRRSSGGMLSLLSVLGLLGVGVGCDPVPPRFDETPPPSPGPGANPGLSFDWSSALVDGDNGGLEVQMNVGTDGKVRLAYFAPQFEDVLATPTPEPSPEPEVSPTPGPRQSGARTAPDAQPSVGTANLYQLRLATLEGSTWNVETVPIQKLNQARGLSLVQTTAGDILISYVQTNPASESLWCSSGLLNVAALAPGSSDWNIQTVAEPYSPADPVCTPNNGCTPCEVVGEFSSMAEGPGGSVGITYRRTRFNLDDVGTHDSDQEFLELTVRDGEVTAGSPDVLMYSTGGGFYGSLAYAKDEGGALIPHVAWMSVTDELAQYSTIQGIWYAQRSGSKWVKAEIQAGRDWMAGPQLQLAATRDDLFVLLYAWKGTGTTAKLDLVMLHSDDQGSTWGTEYLTDPGREGSFPSMALLSTGQPVVSYYVCGAELDKVCEASNDGLRVAVRDAGLWSTFVVQEDPYSYDGMYSAVGVQGDAPVVAARAGIARTPEEVRELMYFESTEQ